MIPVFQTQKSLTCTTRCQILMIGNEDILGHLILLYFFRLVTDLSVICLLGKNVRAWGLGSLLSCQCRGQGVDGLRHC
jgi:hypothetical protein